MNSPLRSFSQEIQLENEKDANYIFGVKIEATYAAIIEEMRKVITPENFVNKSLIFVRRFTI